ncbi:MAG TPA: D-sedoheptulose 7-phosphate isomerase [Blastocatellia bacterium]|nr:D-sedoheptulose 7-phosphate isomerase [Blastocatellia bacterium]
MTKYLQLINQRTAESIAVKRALLESQAPTIADVGAALVEAMRNGQTLFLFGNGGSAGDAQHIAAELVGRFTKERRALPAVALTTNTSALTALGNDYEYAIVFSRQLEAFGKPGDIAIGISTSGNSPNVLHGLETAKTLGMVTVGLTGETGGKTKDAADHCICVPSRDTARIQESHILIGHILCEIVECELFG